MKTPSGDVICRAILLHVSADLPARAKIANMKQFNGAYGCLFGENPGSTLPHNPLHRFWPDVPSAPQRTHVSVLNNARDAISSGDAVSNMADMVLYASNKKLHTM